MEDIRQFEKMSNRYGFACDACSDITDEKLNEMDDETYVKLFFHL